MPILLWLIYPTVLWSFYADMINAEAKVRVKNDPR
jgi:hypothetical protein